MSEIDNDILAAETRDEIPVNTTQVSSEPKDELSSILAGDEINEISGDEADKEVERDQSDTQDGRSEAQKAQIDSKNQNGKNLEPQELEIAQNSSEMSKHTTEPRDEEVGQQILREIRNDSGDVSDSEPQRKRFKLEEPAQSTQLDSDSSFDSDLKNSNSNGGEEAENAEPRKIVSSTLHGSSNADHKTTTFTEREATDDQSEKSISVTSDSIQFKSQSSEPRPPNLNQYSSSSISGLSNDVTTSALPPQTTVNSRPNVYTQNQGTVNSTYPSYLGTSPLNSSMIINSRPQTTSQFPKYHVDPQPPKISTLPKALPPKTFLPKKNRLVLLYDKPRYYHMIMQLSELKNNPNEIVTIIELFEIDKFVNDVNISRIKFDDLNICIEYNDEFESNLTRFTDFIEAQHEKFGTFAEVNYHIHFAPDKKWNEDYTEDEKAKYRFFLDTLNKHMSEKVVHCSVINKYDMDTVYVTERNELTKLGKEIQEDIEYWKNLRILDYGESSIRFLPGVKFPDTLEVLNIGGGYALETLTGFKMPSQLKTLLASQGAISSIDNITFSPNLERLELADNKIYFLNQVEFPSRLEHLDISQNRVESLRGVNFPRRLKSLNLGFNPIESIKGVKFPDNLQYLDISNIPNESMTGVKFPDSLIVLNLQASMTNTRGLKLPATLNKAILSDNGVNSINPLKLPNSIEVLYLNNNNIKTLNKVQFPSSLRELYLGDNLITTLKNVLFPSSLEVLDLEMDPDYDEHEKHITTLKDVVFPPNLKVLKLGYHSIKSIESMEFPNSLVTLSLAYNELKTIRNVRLGNNLKTLDLSGNDELTNIDQLMIPESVSELRIPPELIPYLPGYIIERANKKQLLLKQSGTENYQ